MSEETLSQEELDALLSSAEIVSDDDAPMGGSSSGGSDKSAQSISHSASEASSPDSSHSTASRAVATAEKPEEKEDVSGPQQNKNIQLLLDIYMNVTVELGRTNMKVKDVLGLGEGSIIELDKPANEKVELLVNNRLVARGEVVVIDENFGVRVNEIIDPKDRIIHMMK